MSDGEFLSLVNQAGTTEVANLGLPPGARVLGVFSTNYLIDGETFRCLTIFTAVELDMFKIWCYDIENDTLYEIYEEPIALDYLTDDRVVDAVNYPENGRDILYFTDNYHEVRFLKCEINAYTPNFLTAYQISLGRKGATGTIALDEISATGGSLLSGTYQFSYRMADPTNKRFTKWSTLTNPVHIYSRDNGVDQVYAGIGLSTTRKIVLEISPSEIESEEFDYMQVAVIENIGPVQPTTADLLDIFLITGSPVPFEYKANTSIGSIPIEDITVDLAQIDTVKTLNVKQNRLFGGNIGYTELLFDAGVAIPPTPPTIPTLADWINNPGGQTWALSATPDTSINGDGGISDYICGAMATEAGSTYSFTITWEVFVGGASAPILEAKVAILDAGFAELDAAIVNYSTVGVKNTTVQLTPPVAGTYLAFNITNNTAFDTKTVELQGATYNAPSAATPGPGITSGSFITAPVSSADAYASDETASRYIGYFRDEVYRFGIVYEDERGNKSSVSPFNLDGLIADNQIQDPLPDVKFPDRSFDPAYSIIDSSNLPRALGLRLDGVRSHPSWAASFEIVRLPRKKKILFQTPVVPMYKLNGIGALNWYPTISQVPAAGGGLADAHIDTAQPMTAGYTYVPKNLFWPELRATEKIEVAQGSGSTYALKGEIKLVRENDYDYAMIYPPQSMYTDGSTNLDPFVFVGQEQLDAVDYALLKPHIEVFSTPPTTSPASETGDYMDTSVLGSFVAVGDRQYFFDSGTGGKSINPQYQNVPITDYEFFPNIGVPASVAGVTVLDYPSMQTTGISGWGIEPSIQKGAVIKLQNTIEDLQAIAPTFANGVLNTVSGGAYIFDGNGPQYPIQVRNDYVDSYSGFVNNDTGIGSDISAVLVANVINGLGDDRYGDLTSFGEYISTGAKYTFTAAERELLQSGTDVSVDIDVWGGDCFVGYHSFKVCDSTYSVVSQNKYSAASLTTATNALKWNRVYPIEGGDDNDAISMPVAVKNSAQYIQVCLESEYNGDARDIDTTPMTATGSVPHYFSTNEVDARVPLNYKYNTNLSRPNNYKVFFPKPEFSFTQNDFPARLVYSDIKIYNSDQAGFDIFRVGNVFDLEETHRGITKLAVAGDHLYAIQQQGITYVPTGERQIEQSSGGELTVRSGDVIGRPIIIDSKRGSQHLRGVVETGGLIYIPDNRNKSVYILGEQQLQAIVKDNETLFRQIFAEPLPEKDVLGWYDPIRRQFWLVAGDSCQISNEALQAWVTDYEFPSQVMGGAYNNGLFILNNTTINSMYTGTVGTLFGEVVTPRVTMSINPDESLSKTFDNVMISASERLQDLDITVRRESSLGDQVIPTVDLDSVSIEGNYRVKVLRDAEDARARGLRAITTISWKAGVTSALQALWCKYRLSSRTPW